MIGGDRLSVDLGAVAALESRTIQPREVGKTSAWNRLARSSWITIALVGARPMAMCWPGVSWPMLRPMIGSFTTRKAGGGV